MRFGARTDPGQRPNNQDAYGHRAGLFLVADGMGGHRGGDVASRLAVERILAYAEGLDPLTELRAGFEAANRSIREHAQANADCDGMGTTVAALIMTPDRAHLAHIGDSRIYRLRGREMAPLTRDHSLVEELVRQGSLSVEEARSHPQRNVVTRALGTTDAPRIEYAEVDLEAGDLFLLCTDGLTSEATDEEIAAVLAGPGDPQFKADRLAELAKELGGSDNITVIVVDGHD